MAIGVGSDQNEPLIGVDATQGGMRREPGAEVILRAADILQRDFTALLEVRDDCLRVGELSGGPERFRRGRCTERRSRGSLDPAIGAFTSTAFFGIPRKMCMPNFSPSECT